MEISNDAIRNFRRHRLADQNPPGRRRRRGRRDIRALMTKRKQLVEMRKGAQQQTKANLRSAAPRPTKSGICPTSFSSCWSARLRKWRRGPNTFLRTISSWPRPPPATREKLGSVRTGRRNPQDALARPRCKQRAVRSARGLTSAFAEGRVPRFTVERLMRKQRLEWVSRRRKTTKILDPAFRLGSAIPPALAAAGLAIQLQ